MRHYLLNVIGYVKKLMQRGEKLKKDEGAGERKIPAKSFPGGRHILSFFFLRRDGFIGACWLKESFRVWT